jgi:hypothetical protein
MQLLCDLIYEHLNDFLNILLQFLSNLYDYEGSTKKNVGIGARVLFPGTNPEFSCRGW